MIPSKRLKLQGTVEKFKDVVIQGSSGAIYTPVFPMKEVLDMELSRASYWNNLNFTVEKIIIDNREYFSIKKFLIGTAMNLYPASSYDNVVAIPFNQHKKWYRKMKIGYRKWKDDGLLKGSSFINDFYNPYNTFAIGAYAFTNSNLPTSRSIYFYREGMNIYQQTLLLNSMSLNDIIWFDIDDLVLADGAPQLATEGRYCGLFYQSNQAYLNGLDEASLEMLIAYDSEIGLYEDSGGAPTSPIISDITKSLFIGDIPLNEYFTAEEQTQLVTYLKEYYFDKYVVYKDIQDLYDRMKSINTKALYTLALSLEKIKTLYTLDYKQMRKTTKDNDKTHSGSVAIDRTEDVTADNDMKRADNPSNITGDLVDTYTTEQERNASTQNRINDEDTITSSTDTEDDITTEEGNLIDKYMEFASKLDDIENPFITYAKAFKNLFLSYDPTETDEYEDAILTGDVYFY